MIYYYDFYYGRSAYDEWGWILMTKKYLSAVISAIIFVASIALMNAQAQPIQSKHCPGARRVG